MKPRFILRRRMCSVQLHNANAIYANGFKLRINEGKVFFDVDTLEETSAYKGGDFLHIGVSGLFNIEPVKSSEVKGHIDVFIPKTELTKIFDALKAEVVKTQQTKLA